ncbi:MAG: phosphate ABC transporter substrate-binding protein [Saprospiraceae bacterium]|nr:phosphate ABC transporter substrate-binding protein [Saprospiraceae bacterium]MBK9631533.1 phosphate ABC transporter substrate-binding protein [Saprospiraceae bacterium]
MIKSIFLTFPIFILLSCGGPKNEASQSVNLKGSDTVLPLAQKTTEGFLKINPTHSITVVGGGSGTGITALMDGNADIAMSSRDLKAEEKLKFKEKGLNIQTITVGVDALAVVVHPSNKVTKLTREQIEGIFTGATKNWSEVGGDDMEIVCYSRENSSGTYEFFKEHVLDKKNYGTGVLNMPATGAIVQSISQTIGAIGYIGMAYVTPEIKTVDVSYDAGQNFYTPNFENAMNKTYPISRPLYYLYDKKIEDRLKPYLDYCLSAEGQNLVKEVGFLPVQK